MTTLKADPTSIRAKATKINGEWPAVPASPIPPDMLQLAGLAMQQVASNHERLQSCVDSGKAEAARLAACLEAAAKAYEQVDEINKTEIESGQPSGTDAVTINPVLPPQVPASGGMCYAAPGNPYEEWPTAAAQLASANMNVLQYAEEMYAFSDAITARAKDFSPGDTHWEGLAAEAAEGKMRQHESWLYEVATKAREIAKQAQDFYNAHEKAKADHPEPLKGEENVVMDFDEYNAKQVKSEGVRGVYSNEVTFTSIDTPAPPEGAYAPTPVFKKDVPPLPEKDNGQQPGGPAAGGGGGGEQPGGTPGETPAVSPASAQNGQQTPPSGEQSGGSPSGGQGSGGSPSGGQGSGGSPAGGGTPTGLPEGLTDMPTDPAIRPASADPAGGGGPGSGSGGGGGGGGGTPNSPLAPAASAGSPSSSPAAVSGGGAAPVGAAGTAGAMGGMPMGGGHGMGGQGGGAKERRRTPGLSPDEELYVEDRPSTEPVIGLRARRPGKDGGQDKEST